MSRPMMAPESDPRRRGEQASSVDGRCHSSWSPWLPGCVAGLLLGGSVRSLAGARLRGVGLLLAGASCELAAPAGSAVGWEPASWSPGTCC